MLQLNTCSSDQSNDPKLVSHVTEKVKSPKGIILSFYPRKSHDGARR